MPQAAATQSRNEAATPGLIPTAASARTKRISLELGRRIGAHKFDMWFAHTALQVDGTVLDVKTDSQFAAKWIDANFLTELREAAQELMGPQAEVRVRVEPQAQKAATAEHKPDIPPLKISNGHVAKSHRHAAGKQQSLRRLEDFVVGPSNKLAFAAACRIVAETDPRCMSPLFIHGDCGVGKTHLLQGVCQRFIDGAGRPQQVRYVTGEQFTNEYITAIRTNALDTFRQKVRKLDLLAIDDVHFLSNKVRTQTEFLYTLDAIDLSGARVVLASDNHPHHIKRFSQALVSRFLSGMVVKIDRPDRATRIELIRRLAAARGLKLNAAAMDLIVSHCVGSVRELEGAVTKLAAYKSLMHNGNNGGANGQHSENDGEIGLVLAEQLFREQAWQPGRAVRMAAVIDAVCERIGVTKADVLGTGRHRRVVLARGLVAHLGRELTTHSYPEIAQALGRNNHSTIHTADQRLRRQVNNDEAFDLGSGDSRINLKELIDQLRRAVLERKDA